ncbi:hypothetical protein HDEF_0039 [Candidatus Hamiltonella defensa 5AT (Acyrthosiphon pisum)]|uniref:Uncharacterized protein n=1 Tax=Hamiltonella defensa subsp. Acyrthosiphon pisum (strain 5AT) TaxID=572265 RepID=C4K854_HAMD5|nr:hypothetical protein HDEF_0039 [Candidatus Hamiltonella defensa 5AT (Acyrthosiphon pisum)]
MKNMKNFCAPDPKFADPRWKSNPRPIHWLHETFYYKKAKRHQPG